MGESRGGQEEGEAQSVAPPSPPPSFFSPPLLTSYGHNITSPHPSITFKSTRNHPHPHPHPHLSPLHLDLALLSFLLCFLIIVISTVLQSPTSTSSFFQDGRLSTFPSRPPPPASLSLLPLSASPPLVVVLLSSFGWCSIDCGVVDRHVGLHQRHHHVGCDDQVSALLLFSYSLPPSADRPA
jgi:hypothetical protein